VQSDAPPEKRGSADQQKHQQEHSEWYAENPVQTYSEYERLPFWQAVDAFTFGFWRPRLRAGQVILDLGCAQGRSTSKLADLDLRIIGFDISKTLVRQAIARPDRRGWRARTTFLVADASSLPFRDATFDGVLVYGVFHHLDDPAAAARDISRVLRDGGLCFALENNKTVLRSVFELLQRVRPAWYEEAGSHALMSVAELEGWLGAAGMSCDARTSVFLPPHLLNQVNPVRGATLLRATDAFLGALPWMQAQGGLVRVLAEKLPARSG
jgi:ubiquinone/menaquinone biosynthesis C-methylase UbiE